MKYPSNSVKSLCCDKCSFGTLNEAEPPLRCLECAFEMIAGGDGEGIPIGVLLVWGEVEL